jgi:hypothetical protein
VAAPILGAINIAPKTMHAPIKPPEKDHIGAFLRSTILGIEGFKKINIIENITTPPKKLIKAAWDGCER